MTFLLDEFELRAAEVNDYFRLLKLLEEDNIVIHRGSKRTHKKKTVSDDCFKIMKANAFLLLYNLVEASVRSSLGAVYEKLCRENQTALDLSSEFQQLWVGQVFSKLDGHSASPRNYQDLAWEIVCTITNHECIQLEEERIPISGNLDADEIRRVCKRHGVSEKTHYRANGGRDLKLVRKQRNALAHGSASFSEVGRQFTVDDLDRIKNQTVVFVRSVLRNVIHFANGRGYAA